MEVNFKIALVWITSLLFVTSSSEVVFHGFDWLLFSKKASVLAYSYNVCQHVLELVQSNIMDFWCKSSELAT